MAWPARDSGNRRSVGERGNPLQRGGLGTLEHQDRQFRKILYAADAAATAIEQWAALVVPCGRNHSFSATAHSRACGVSGVSGRASGFGKLAL